MDRVILIGFMGSGKTSVGRLLADRLAWDFVDTDALVQEQAGARIADIFRSRGEPAFRRLEAEVLASLRDRGRVVIATGGGAPAQEGNRDFFAGQRVFHLRVSLANVLRRTAGGRERPLLWRPDDEVSALFEQRRLVYESMGTGIETDGRPPGDIAEEILDLLRNPRPSRQPGDSA